MASDFLFEMIVTILNVALIAFVGRWAAREFTSQPPETVGFALALGLLAGRGQSDGLSEAGRLGAFIGGALCVALLWYVWFRRARSEAGE